MARVTPSGSFQCAKLELNRRGNSAADQQVSPCAYRWTVVVCRRAKARARSARGLSRTFAASEGTMKKSRDDSAGVRVYQLKVVLRDVRPPVWRRILVRSDATLAELHHDLQVIMGWTDSHMHSFQAAKLFYGTEFSARTVESRDERRTKLSDVLRKVKDKMTYEYDFGDGWTHQIYLEKVEALAPGAKYPWVITGRRACPPEDVGGPFGYAHFLGAVQ
jgi:hypothetical protein